MGHDGSLAVCVRQSTVERGDADFQAPENGRVEGPADDLDLGSPDTVVVFTGVWIDVCALIRRHVAIGKTFKFCADKIGCYNFCDKEKLDYNGLTPAGSQTDRARKTMREGDLHRSMASDNRQSANSRALRFAIL